MVKILSKAGDSLADIYDVEGSIAGIDSLETKELPIVHELGATVFSERFSSNIRRGTSGGVAQSTAWDVEMANFGASTNIVRILSVAVFVDTTARVDHVTVSVRDVLNGREVPIFSWDTNNGGTETAVRIVEEGAAAAETIQLIPKGANVILPTMLVGPGQPNQVPEIAFRGITTAFGAGTVVTTVLIQQAFAQLRGVSSRGLPVPSW
jgi:hypothetical protein